MSYSYHSPDRCFSICFCSLLIIITGVILSSYQTLYVFPLFRWIQWRLAPSMDPTRTLSLDALVFQSPDCHQETGAEDCAFGIHCAHPSSMVSCPLMPSKRFYLHVLLCSITIIIVVSDHCSPVFERVCLHEAYVGTLLTLGAAFSKRCKSGISRNIEFYSVLPRYF
ncbi:hypothetical protein BDV06DRAFT_2500 [Aspergillus oleicola]